MRIEDGNFFATPAQLKRNLGSWRFECEALLKNLLGERMPDAVGIGILDIAPHAIWAVVNVLVSKRIRFKNKAVRSIVKAGIRLEVEMRCLLKQLLCTAARLVGLNFDLLNHFLVEVIGQLFLRKCTGLRHFCFKIVLQLIELKGNLLRCSMDWMQESGTSSSLWHGTNMTETSSALPICRNCQPFAGSCKTWNGWRRRTQRNLRHKRQHWKTRCCKKNATNFLQKSAGTVWYTEKRFRLNPARKCYKCGGAFAIVPHEAASSLILQGGQKFWRWREFRRRFWSKTVPKLYQNLVILGILDISASC